MSFSYPGVPIQSDSAPFPMFCLSLTSRPLSSLLSPSDLVPSGPTSFLNPRSVSIAITSGAPQCLASITQRFPLHPTPATWHCLITGLITLGPPPYIPCSIPAIFRVCCIEGTCQCDVTERVSHTLKCMHTSHIHIYRAVHRPQLPVHIHIGSTDTHTHTNL